MRRLIFLVIGVRKKNRREAIERDHAVRLRVTDRKARPRWLQLLVIVVIVKRPRRTPAQNYVIEGAIDQPRQQTGMKRGPDVARVLKFLPQPGLLEPGWIAEHL